MEYRTGKRADDDIDEIYSRGYWQFGEHQADKFLSKLLDTFESLVIFPELGAIESNFAKGLRRIEFHPYSIFYMRKPYGIYIARIVRQDRIVNHSYFSGALDEADG